MPMSISAVALVMASASALVAPSHAPKGSLVARRMLGDGGNFGDVFYMGYEYAPPNGLSGELPEGTFEVCLKKPCGIVFEEIGTPSDPKGVKVIDLVEGGNAEASGAVAVDDVLVGLSAVRFSGAKFERNMFPATKMDFDTVVEGIGSNKEEWKCKDVFLQFSRPVASPPPAAAEEA